VKKHKGSSVFINSEEKAAPYVYPFDKPCSRTNILLTRRQQTQKLALKTTTSNRHYQARRQVLRFRRANYIFRRANFLKTNFLSTTQFEGAQKYLGCTAPEWRPPWIRTWALPAMITNEKRSMSS